MKKNILWLGLSCLLVIAILLASCSTSRPATTTTRTTATTTAIATSKPATVATAVPTSKPVTPTTGKWWYKFGEPQYGDVITVLTTSDYTSFDPYRTLSSIPYFETLGTYSWTVERETWNFQTNFVPEQYRAGLLAESWEQPDLKTTIFHLRKGVRWHDKAPVNGRELTSDDIVYSYNRLFGLGSGFTKPSPYFDSTPYAGLTSVTTPDKYTVVFNWRTPSLDNLATLMDVPSSNFIMAREVVDKYGNLEDWRNAVGTGPFMLNDYVSSSSLTFIRNPNYWGYDERHPENKLPYADAYKILIISDIATQLSALRTSKVDFLPNLSWDKAATLTKTNPELQQIATPAPGVDVDLRCDKAPFTDLRVRTALQMSIDLNTIAATYYGGSVDGTPCGLVPPAFVGYYTPYNKWPQKIKDEYAYNPSMAKKLLSEAGYPNGFKTNVVARTNSDLDLLQIIKSYFSDIGVDMEIRVMDVTSWTTFARDGKQDQMVLASGSALSVAVPNPPDRILARRISNMYTNYTFNNDPVFDKFYQKYTTSLDPIERQRMVVEGNDYAIAQHWSVNILPLRLYNIYQPWFKGYSGEYAGNNGCLVTYSAKLWIDQKLRRSMGR